MNTLFDPKRILYKIRTKKRWWLPAFVLTVALVNALGLFRAKRYDSYSLIFINQPPISDYNVNQSFDLALILDTINERVNSVSFLSQVATAVNLDAGLDPGSADYNALMARMKKNIELRANRRQLSITYSGYSPAEARNTTQAIVDLLIKQFTNYYGGRTDQTTDFLEARLKQYNTDLAFAQQKITDYKKQVPEFLPALQPTYAGQKLDREDELSRTREELSATSRTMVILQAARAKTPPQLEQEIEEVSGGSEQQRLEGIKRQIELEIADLLRDFTEEWREVKEKRQQLALIEDQLSSATVTRSSRKIAQPNPKYAELERDIAAAASEMLRLQEKTRGLERDIAEKQKYLDAIPLVEDKLATLEADFTAAKVQADYYTKLLNEAKRAKEATNVGMGPSLTVIDPPEAPTAPSSPNRTKIAIVGVFLGGCVAAGIVLLFAMADTSLRSVEEARLVLRMPVLGIVQRIQTPSQARALRRRQILTYAGSLAFVAIVCGAGVYSYANYREDILLGFNQLRALIDRF